jgi:hypothetical protein
MGIDYYSCCHCGESFPDVDEYVSCECGNKWCCDECAEEDGFIRGHCTKYPILNSWKLMNDYCEENCKFDTCTSCEYYEPDSCKYCRHEDYDDYELLGKALELLKMSRDDLIAVINKEQLQI